MPRYTFQFEGDTDETLTALAAEKHMTKSEIIRRALGTYSYLNKQLKEGDNRVTISDAKGKVLREIALP